MTTFVRAPEAARLLGVSTPTLYAYVSRGRLARRRSDDGRTSLFDRDEVVALADRSRRRPHGPPPSIDVRVESSITRLGEEAILVRGHDLAAMAPDGFEHVAAVLWGLDPGTDGVAQVVASARRADRERLGTSPTAISIRWASSPRRRCGWRPRHPTTTASRPRDASCPSHPTYSAPRAARARSPGV